MKDTALTGFKIELNSFFALVILNITFGALAMAIGVSFMVTAVLGLAGAQIPLPLRIIAGSFFMICFGLGFMWVLTSARILKGITGVRREYRKQREPVPGEILTGWIVRLMANYRENKKTISWMILICSLGGGTYLVLGILNIIQGITPVEGALDIWTRVLPFAAAAINLTIGLASLLSGYYLSKFSKTWDRRLEEVERSEDTLKKTLGLDRP
jgi:hypothetical protein